MERILPGFIKKWVATTPAKSKTSQESLTVPLLPSGSDKPAEGVLKEEEEEEMNVIFLSGNKLLSSNHQKDNEPNPDKESRLDKTISRFPEPKRIFLVGTRTTVPLNFSGLDWIKNEEDASLLRMVAKVAANHATKEDCSVCDLSVYNESVEGYEQYTDECLLYRMVLSLSNNVPVSSETLNAIESCSPSRIQTGVVTHIPKGYRRPTGISDEDEAHKLFVRSRGTSYKGIVGGNVTTNITIYVSSVAHKRIQKLVS